MKDFIFTVVKRVRTPTCDLTLIIFRLFNFQFDIATYITLDVSKQWSMPYGQNERSV